MAAVRVVLPWSTWPMVPMLTCGLLRSNFAFATAGPPQDFDDPPSDQILSSGRSWVDLDLIDVQSGPLVNRLVADAPSFWMTTNLLEGTDWLLAEPIRTSVRSVSLAVLLRDDGL